MEDLSTRYFPDGPVAALVPSNQHAGNRPSNQDAAMSAPGTDSPAVDTGDLAQPPFASGTAYDGRFTYPNRRGPEGTADALRASNPGRRQS